MEVVVGRVSVGERGGVQGQVVGRIVETTLQLGERRAQRVGQAAYFAVIRALERGMRSLLEDGLAKAREGITSAEEVLRVTE